MGYKYLSMRFTFILSLLVVFACKSKPEKCKYKPVAIFEAGLPHIQQYNYEVQGSQSMESLLLDTGILLEVAQDV